MSSALLHEFLHPFLTFVLVLTRLSGLAMTAPVFGARAAPPQVRGLLAVATALLITPLFGEVEIEANNLLQLTSAVLREAGLGLAMGVGVMVMFTSMQLTGQVIGQMSGMQLADVFDPTHNASIPVFAQLIDLVAVAVFILIGGHRAVMMALLDTFAWIPPGEAAFSEGMLEGLLDVIQMSFLVGIRTSAPIMISLLMSMLILGLISRTLPQLNILLIGFNLNSMVMLATLAVCIGGIVWVFENEVLIAIDNLRTAIFGAPPSLE
ncbi:MAG: flagellar biosynthetic protein FliR [Pirellulaceae bacterium]|jgi:flagellar biosynthetic protein FliR|nr:flagellar biosynthetic protein FliR [Pirellulaceae bacterium]